MVDNTFAKPAVNRRLLGRKARLALAAVAVLAVAGTIAAATALLLLQGNDDSRQVVTGVQISYPLGWQEQVLSEADRNAGLLVSLEHADSDAVFLARTVIGTLADDFSIDQLSTDSRAALASEVNGFRLLSNEITNIAGLDVVRIHYEQASESASDRFQSLMIIAPRENQTFYLTLRAEDSNFAEVESDGTQMMTEFLAKVATVQ